MSRSESPDRRTVALTPSAEDGVDAAALFTLGAVAILELHSTFSGSGFFGVGIVGLVLGIVIAHVANVLARPVIVLAAMGLTAFFLLGGVVSLRHAPTGGVLPTGSTLHALANVSVHGWKSLLTTLPPVDGQGSLLVLPYILGLFCGLTGFALARRTQRVFPPLLAPLAVLALVILLGSNSPGDRIAIAAVFGAVALLWAALRSRRLRPVVSSGAGLWSRITVAAALLTLAALGGYVLGPNVPGASAHERLVLRKHVNPPANIDDYPSPLAEYRLYVAHQKVGQQLVTLANKPLFTVGGTLPVGSPIRFATLDSYNGIVWAATTNGSEQGTTPNTFLTVGPKLDDPATGPSYSMTVDVDNYDDYWMPDAGSIQALRFSDADATQQSTDFRYDLATRTGVVPGKLARGASYAMTVAGVQQSTLRSSDVLATGAAADSGAFIKETALALSGTPGNTTAEVQRIGQQLKSIGHYTHGDPGTSFAYYLPGSSVGRLTDFVKGVLPGAFFVGDDEQYAAAYALMIQDLGVPARVVVGVESMPANRVVTGSDVDAWVEVQSVDGTWRTIPTSTFLDKNNPPDKKQLQQQQQQEAGSVVPPPAQGRPRTAIDDAAQSVGDSNDIRKKKPGALRHHAAASHLPAWLVTVVRTVGGTVLLMIAIGLAIIGAKSLRRYRRRSRGSPAVRLARGWREVTDHARDLGRPVVARTTRREAARSLQMPGVYDLASLADAQVFGETGVSDDDVSAFWSEVQRTRKLMAATVGRGRRLRAALSLATFFPPRAEGVRS